MKKLFIEQKRDSSSSADHSNRHRPQGTEAEPPASLPRPSLSVATANHEGRTADPPAREFTNDRDTRQTSRHPSDDAAFARPNATKLNTLTTRRHTLAAFLGAVFVLVSGMVVIFEFVCVEKSEFVVAPKTNIKNQESKKMIACERVGFCLLATAGVAVWKKDLRSLFFSFISSSLSPTLST